MGVLCIGNDHLDVSGIYTVFQILFSEHRRRRAIHHTHLDHTQHKEPPFRHTRKHNEDAFPFCRPVFGDHIGHLIRAPGEIAEGEFHLFPLLVHPDHRQFIPIPFRPCINDIKTEIVIFRHINGK